MPSPMYCINDIDFFLGKVYLTLICIAFISATHLFYKGSLNWKIILFICAGILTELLIILFKEWGLSKGNPILVFSYFISIFLTLSIFYWSAIQHEKIKKIYLFFSLFYIPILIGVIWTNDNINRHNVLFMELVCLNNVFLSLLFFIDILLRDKIIQIRSFRDFWFTVAIFFWSLFYIFKIGAMYYFNITNPKFLTLTAVLFRGFNIIAYLIIIYSLYCENKLLNKCRMLYQKLLHPMRSKPYL